MIIWDFVRSYHSSLHSIEQMRFQFIFRGALRAISNIIESKTVAPLAKLRYVSLKVYSETSSQIKTAEFWKIYKTTHANFRGNGPSGKDEDSLRYHRAISRNAWCCVYSVHVYQFLIFSPETFLYL